MGLVMQKKKRRKRVKLTKEEMKEKRLLHIEFAGIVIVFCAIVTLLIYAATLKRYTVTFDSVGGNQVSSQKVIEGHTVSEPNDPIREGYIFLGWYYHDELFDFQDVIETDIKLEAKWEKIDPTKVSGISLNESEISLLPGNTLQLREVISPATALNQSVTWISSDEAIAKVDETGLITAIKEGDVLITATTEDGNYQATCKVKVTTKAIALTAISFQESELNVSVEEQVSLQVKYTPSTATNRNVIWTSGDEAIAKVDQDGKVTGVKQGTTTITALSQDGGYKAQITIIVKGKQEEKE